MLTEQFREAARDEDAGARGAEFMRLLADAGRDSASLEAALREPDGKKAEAAFESMGRRCTACHARFRDAAPAR